MNDNEDYEVGTEELGRIVERLCREIAAEPSRSADEPASLVTVRRDIDRAADVVIELYGKTSMFDAVERARKVEAAEGSAFAKAVRVEVQRRAREMAPTHGLKAG